MAPLICGAFSQSEDDDDDEHNTTSSCFIQRRSRKHITKKYINTNPYSSLGLEKFSKLLSKLEEKKKQIYSESNPQDTSLVRFICKGLDPDEDCKPVVIKLRQDRKKLVMKQQCLGPLDHTEQEANSSAKPRKIQWSTNAMLMIVLILVCLAVFGRSGSTLILAIGWYLVPAVSDSGSENCHSGHKPTKAARNLPQTLQLAT